MLTSAQFEPHPIGRPSSTRDIGGRNWVPTFQKVEPRIKPSSSRDENIKHRGGKWRGIMTATPPIVQRSRKPYVYEKLCDLRQESSPVNVMGVVVLFKPPYQSKGRDYTCTMEIVDEGSRENSVPLIFFNRDVQKLPQSCNIGDVVCVRRVDLGEFNGRLQGKCRNHSTWLMWDGQNTGRRPPAVTSDGVSWDPSEMSRAAQLITWSIPSDTDSQLPLCSHQQTAVMQSPLRVSALPSIADITLTDQKINVIGIVKSVSTPQKSRGPDFFVSAVLIDESSPTDGLPFTFFNPIENLLPKFGDLGSAAYLVNVKITNFEDKMLGCGHQRSQVICFSLQPNGEMVSTSSADSNVPSAVKERAKALLEWVCSAQPLLSTVEDSQLDSQSQALSSPLPTFLTSRPSESESIFVPPTPPTLMLHPTWPISTLREVQDCQNIPSCFRIRVKVLQVLQPLDECCQLRCPKCKYQFTHTNSKVCDNCTTGTSGGSPELRFMYCLSFLVGDTSATGQAHLSDTDADEFFQDLSPVNLSENLTVRDSLMKVLSTLTGRPEPFLTPNSPSSLLTDSCVPWTDCCVQSYPSCKGTQLRIVDTWLVACVASS